MKADVILVAIGWGWASSGRWILRLETALDLLTHFPPSPSKGTELCIRSKIREVGIAANQLIRALIAPKSEL